MYWLKKILLGAVVVLVWVFATAYFVFAIDMLDLPYSTRPGFEFGALFLSSTVAIVCMIMYRRRSRDRRITEDAKRWLVRRQSQLSRPVLYKRLRNVRRAALWVPSLISAATLLFTPEICALLSHLKWPASISGCGYRVTTPLNWWVLYESSGAEGGYINAYVGHGLLRGGIGPQFASSGGFEYFDRRVGTPISEVLIEANNQPEQDPLPKVASIHRTIQFHGGSLECWEFSGYKQGWKAVRCRTSDWVLQARFSGEQNEVAGFYEVLRNIRAENGPYPPKFVPEGLR